MLSSMPSLFRCNSHNDLRTILELTTECSTRAVTTWAMHASQGVSMRAGAECVAWNWCWMRTEEPSSLCKRFSECKSGVGNRVEPRDIFSPQGLKVGGRCGPAAGGFSSSADGCVSSLVKLRLGDSVSPDAQWEGLNASGGLSCLWSWSILWFQSPWGDAAALLVVMLIAQLI